MLQLQQTCDTLVAGIHVGNEVLAARVYFEQLRRRDRYQTALPGGTAGGEMVEDVGRTSDVVVVRYAATDPHPTVERRRDENHLVVTARRVETFPLAVLLARHCNSDNRRLSLTDD